MPTRVLLLCDDEKAQAAVTQVFAELKVVFEHLREPSSALKRIATQRFDAILVDCDNEPIATQVFQNVLSSTVNQAAMTIAIVEGKGGVPRGFRLGARLVLTKPVSLEQARSTLRSAFAMQRKIAQEAAIAPAPKRETAAANRTGEKMSSSTTPVTSSEPAKPAPEYSLSFKLQTLPEVDDVSSEDPAPVDHNTIIAPGITRTSSMPIAASPAVAAPLLKETAMKPAASKSAPANEMLEDDPFFPGDLEGRVITGGKPAAASVAPDKRRRRVSSVLVALIIVFLAVDGFYAVWTLKPEFQDAVLEQYGRLHERLTGTPSKPVAADARQPVPAPVQSRAAQKPGTSPASASTSASVDSTPPDSPATETPVADGFSSPQSPVSEGFRSNSAPNKSAPPALRATSASVSNSNDDKEPAVVPEKLADAHVAHRVRPAYPAWVRNKGVQGDVVLQANVNADGTVGSVQVISGKPQLTPSAVAAVKQWRYEPYFRKGQAIEFQTRVTIQFRLSQPASP